MTYASICHSFLQIYCFLAVVSLVVLRSRANPSYMYQNFVLVGSTRGSSALPKNQQIIWGPHKELRMLRIVFLSADVPEVSVHGLLAVRVVLLCLERSEVLSHVAQVFAASLHGA